MSGAEQEADRVAFFAVGVVCAITVDTYTYVYSRLSFAVWLGFLLSPL